MSDSGNGTVLKILTGICASLVVALITGFGVSIEGTLKTIEHEQYIQGQKLVELQERILLFRERQVENEAKIEKNRVSLEEVKDKLSLVK